VVISGIPVSAGDGPSAASVPAALSAAPGPLRRACQVYLEHPHGRLRDVVSTGAPVSWVESADRWPVFEPAEPQAPARRRAVLVTKRPGELLGDQTDSEARSASVIFDLPLEADCARLAGAVADEVRVVVDG